MAKTKGNRGRRETGTRRGSGSRKQGLSRWATIWMDEVFDYFSAMDNMRSIDGDDAESLAGAIGEMEEFIEEWEDIAGKLGGTVFLDYCQQLAWRILSEAYGRLAELRAELKAALIEEALTGRR